MHNLSADIYRTIRTRWPLPGFICAPELCQVRKRISGCYCTWRGASGAIGCQCSILISCHVQHRKSAHPPCFRCEDRSVCEETIGKHYFLSANHPSCITCKVGFKDEASELQVGHLPIVVLMYLHHYSMGCQSTQNEAAHLARRYSKVSMQ